MVVLNESLQIIENSMDETVVVRNRGGGCIVNHPPLFSPDGKYVYILCGWCVSAYSVQTGDCTHQFTLENKEEIVSIATYNESLLATTSTGIFTLWNTTTYDQDRKFKLALKNQEVVRIFPVSSQEKHSAFDLITAVREKDKTHLQFLRFSSITGKHQTNFYLGADDKPHSATVCEEFVAAFRKERLTVVDLSNDHKKTSLLAGQGRHWTAVVAAPRGWGLAAGDNTGRILYWPQPHLSQTRTVFHWHTLPVATITFSASGSYMYSGAGEGVMVRWNLEVSNMKNFLPRLPAPILHLSVSPDNQYVAIATEDNSIQLADSQHRVSSVIQRLAWGVPGPTSGLRLFPAGLVWDPLSRSLVLNGRPGHLQFFNTDDNRLLFNLDITNQNYVSQERNKEIINTEVTHVTLSHDGKWMVTVETRDDRDTFIETLLKIWQYKFNARQFSLNTCVQLPHGGRVNRLRFQPASTVPDHYLLVTSGTDCKFRLWTPSRSESIHSEGLRWLCESVGFYRDLPADCIAFSSDGSILAVSFGSSLTLWDADNLQLNTSLTRDCYILKAVEFGSHECCHLVVTGSDFYLNVWSILTLQITWTVPITCTQLCTDPLSSNMAVFTGSNSVFVFSPSSSTPLYERKDIVKSGQRVLAAVFVPRPHKLLDTNTSWCSDSQLHFIDTNQELHYLELESEQDPEEGVIRSSRPGTQTTPFSLLAARQSASEVERASGVVHQEFGTKSDAAVRKLLASPAHTMPHIHLFCQSFLKSLAVTSHTKQENTTVEEKMEVDENSDTDNEKKSKKSKNVAKKRFKNKNKAKVSADLNNKSLQKKASESPSKKKPKKKGKNEKKTQRQRKDTNSFSIDDLDKDWMSVLEKT